MIKLTLDSGISVWVNPRKIKMIETSPTCIWLGKDLIWIKETPEQIITLIESYKHSRNED